MPNSPRIVIAGAGSIGCYVGGSLALAGLDVTLLLRPRMAEELRTHGLTLSDYEGRKRRLAPEQLQLATDPAALAQADVVLVTVKSAATSEIGAQIADHARPGILVVSLQNGVGNADVLREAAPQQNVAAGMVPFNVLQQGEGRFHRGTEGAVIVAASAADLAQQMKVEGMDCETYPDMNSLMWGKLLLNLNNALNALSGVPLLEELQNREWRKLLAAMMDEALAAMRAAGITPAKVAAVPPRVIPHVLRLPTPLYRLLFGAMLKIDPQARSSMWEDLKQGRTTEIAYLQGAVVGLAAKHGVAVPVCARVTTAIHKAETAKAGSPMMLPEALLAG